MSGGRRAGWRAEVSAAWRQKPERLSVACCRCVCDEADGHDRWEQQPPRKPKASRLKQAEQADHVRAGNGLGPSCARRRAGRAAADGAGLSGWAQQRPDGIQPDGAVPAPARLHLMAMRRRGRGLETTLRGQASRPRRCGAGPSRCCAGHTKCRGAQRASSRERPPWSARQASRAPALYGRRA